MAAARGTAQLQIVDRSMRDGRVVRRIWWLVRRMRIVVMIIRIRSGGVVSEGVEYSWMAGMYPDVARMTCLLLY